MGDHLDDNAASEFVSGALSAGAMRKAEGHLASCRDCRALVAALAQGDDDSSAATFRYELVSVSQAAELPKKSLSVGDRVGRYLVLSSIGAGGMGVVFAAYDPQLDRKIALKLLRSGLAGSSQDARTRLRREAQAIAQLSHPNVVSIYDVGTTDDGDLYIAMEFVEGDTLTSWLKKYPRTWREIIDVFVQAARGLIAAHGVGLLHRDFKPDNVLVGGDGRVRVTDFGLARSLLTPDELVRPHSALTALDAALTATGTVLGTPRYMPPEQMTGHDLDARSDQFSFCVALYEALYGGHPLRDGTSLAMLEHGDIAMPPPEASKVPAELGRAVLRGLERDRARRFPSMATLIQQLVPAPRRPTTRYVALAGAAVVLIGGSTAAMLAKDPRTLPAPPPDQTVIQSLKHDKDVLEEKVAKLTRELEHSKGLDHDEIAQYKAELDDKKRQIDELTKVVTVLQDKVTRASRAADTARKAAKPSLLLISDALLARQAAVIGCFDEWSPRNAHADATLVVALAVAPDGSASLRKIVRTPDDHPPTATGAQGHSSLELCASDAVALAHFPTTAEAFDLEVSMVWSGGQLRILPNLTTAPWDDIEL